MFRKKGLSVDEKIKRATVRKKWQMVGMYMIGVLSGVSWTYTAIIGADMVREYTTPSVYHFDGVKTEVPKVEAIVWNTAMFTSYSAGDGYTPGRTMASGKKVYVGAVACPRDIALGSVVEVRGLGLYTCEDRKAIDHDGEFDIYSDNVDDALSFGRKTLDYRIIEGA